MFELAYWQRAVRDPIILSGMIVDFLPLFAVLSFGWGAFELVFLYWIENLILGVVTLVRILMSGLGKGQVTSTLRAVFTGTFFTVHYGGFCLAHGIALVSMLGSPSSEGLTNAGIEATMSSHSFVGLPVILGAIIVWQFYINVFEFFRREEYLEADAQKEMFAPYGRIIVLHLGVFAGAFAMAKYGEPMMGVLALILFRVAIGIVVNSFLRNRRSRKNVEQFN